MANPDPIPTHAADARTRTASAAGPTAPAPPPPAPASEPLPAAIGPYRVLALLGRGGMGVVYRAEDPGLRREVAVKVLHPRFAAHPAAHSRFVREARAQAKVEHDHVAAIFQVGEDRGAPYLAMPLLKGMTLHAALRANPRPPLREVVRIAREVAEGLAAAHAQGLVHRDVKPSNVWLEGARLRVKILDFGLARSADESGAGDATEPITAEGAVLGTPAYMSPEQARGDAVDHRTDLFSLGTVLYQMTTGRLPFTGAGSFAIQTAVTAHDPPPARDLAPDLPPPLDDLISRLMAKHPAARPPSAAAVADELRQVELHLVATVRVVVLDTVPGTEAVGPDPFASLDATEPSTAVRTVGRSPRWLWAVAALAVLAAVGAVGWATGLFAPRKPADPPPEPDPPPRTPPPNISPPKAVPLPPDHDPDFFNGRALDGWVGGKQGVAVTDDGGIDVSVGPGRGFYRDRVYRDFRLSFRARNTQRKGWNLLFRAAVGGPVGHLRGPAVSFAAGPWGRLLIPGKDKGPPQTVLNPGTETAGSNDGFNNITVECVGSRVAVTVNGVTTADGEFDLPAEGRVGFNFGSNPDEVNIRDVRFTDLSFFNGRDLAGWSGAPGHWRVENGELVGSFPADVVPVNTYLISTREYADFELTFQARLKSRTAGGARPATGGVVFRGLIADPARHQVNGLWCMLGGEFWGGVRGSAWVSLTKPAPEALSLARPDDFNDVSLRCVGTRITVTVNGAVALNEDREKLRPTGVLAWWLVPGLEELRVRNVRFTDLSATKKP